jgi:hypothetical protein
MRKFTIRTVILNIKLSRYDYLTLNEMAMDENDLDVLEG